MRSILTTLPTLAIILAGLIGPGGQAAAAEPQPQPEKIGLLAVLEGSAASALRPGGLGGEVDAALAALGRAHSNQPARPASRHGAVATTLGIGRLGNDLIFHEVHDPNGRPLPSKALASTAARRVAAVFDGVSGEVSACYGQPMHDGRLEGDSFLIGVEIDATGRVMRVRMLRAAAHGAADLDGCVRDVLSRVAFPGGIGPVAVRRAYVFRFAAQDIDLS